MAGFGKYMAWTFPAIVDLTMITAMVTVVWSAKAANMKPTRKPATKKAPTVTIDRPALETTSKPVAQPAGKSKARLDVAAVADVLAVDPTVTAQVLAERFGVSKRTIQRTTVWKNRNNEEANNENGGVAV